MQWFQKLCGNSIASGASIEASEVRVYPEQGSNTMLNLRTIYIQAMMRAIGKELCNGIINMNVHWAKNSWHKFQINQIRIA